MKKLITCSLLTLGLITPIIASCDNIIPSKVQDTTNETVSLTLNLKSDDNKINENKISTYAKGQIIYLSNEENDNYHFSGWYYDSNYKYPISNSLKLDSDIIIYGLFEEINDEIDASNLSKTFESDIMKYGIIDLNKDFKVLKSSKLSLEDYFIYNASKELTMGNIFNDTILFEQQEIQKESTINAVSSSKIYYTNSAGKYSKYNYSYLSMIANNWNDFINSLLKTPKELSLISNSKIIYDASFNYQNQKYKISKYKDYIEIDIINKERLYLYGSKHCDIELPKDYEKSEQTGTFVSASIFENYNLNNSFNASKSSEELKYSFESEYIINYDAYLEFQYNNDFYRGNIINKNYKVKERASFDFNNLKYFSSTTEEASGEVSFINENGSQRNFDYTITASTIIDDNIERKTIITLSTDFGAKAITIRLNSICDDKPYFSTYSWANGKGIEFKVILNNGILRTNTEISLNYDKDFNYTSKSQTYINLSLNGYFDEKAFGTEEIIISNQG